MVDIASPRVTRDEESALIAAAQDGDREAYGALVRKYQELAVRTAAYMGAGSGAEDAAQDAFIAAWSALHTFDLNRPFKPWLLRIVTNRVRRNQRLWARRHDILDEAMHLLVSVPSEASDEAVLTADLQRRLYAAIDSLPTSQRLVVTCRYLLELSESETAQALSWPTGSVKSRLHRALQRLREDPALTQLVEGV